MVFNSQSLGERKDRSTSAPVTSMDRHANTRRKRKGRTKKGGRRKEGESECTYHVYGQTHPGKGRAREGEMTRSHN